MPVCISDNWDACHAERHSTYHVPYRPVYIYTWPRDGRDRDMNIFLSFFIAGPDCNLLPLFQLLDINCLFFLSNSYLLF